MPAPVPTRASEHPLCGRLSGSVCILMDACAPAETPFEGNAMHPDGQNGKPRHILVVNHAPEILDLVKELLEDDGYRVTTRSRDAVGVDDIVDLHPDLIVLDYMWSSSDADWSLLNLLRIDRRTRDIPVVLCTAAVRQVREMEAHLDAMGVRVVLKPFDIDHLIDTVRQALEAVGGAVPEQ